MYVNEGDKVTKEYPLYHKKTLDLSTFRCTPLKIRFRVSTITRQKHNSRWIPVKLLQKSVL